MSDWESLLLGALLLLFMFWMWPGIRHTMKASKQAETDWPGLLMPVGCVILFVIFLIATV